jgi:hypothetical protein
MSPERATQKAGTIRIGLNRPFRAPTTTVLFPQGVALGWDDLPLWGDKAGEASHTRRRTPIKPAHAFDPHPTQAYSRPICPGGQVNAAIHRRVNLEGGPSFTAFQTIGFLAADRAQSLECARVSIDQRF